MIKIEFIFSGKTYEKKIMCESLQIREICMFEKRISMPTKRLIQKREISRKKRQVIAVAGIVGYVDSELINHFMSNGFHEHTKNLENDVQILKLHDIETLTELKSLLSNTELYFDNTEKLLAKMSKQQCNENFLNRKIQIDEFLHIITEQFLTSINLSLINIMNKIPTNQVITLAEKLCSNMNKKIDQIFCYEFYQINENYKILSIEPFGFAENKAGSILLNIEIVLPFFTNLESKTYNLISIPKPLYSVKGLNHFQTSFVSKNIVE